MKDNTRKTLKIYWQHTQNYRVQFWAVTFGTTIAIVLQTIAPIYFKKFFDLLALGSDNIEEKKLVNILIMIAVFSFSAWFFRRVSTFVAAYYQSRVIKNLTDSALESMQKHSTNFFNDNFVGSLVKKIKWFSNAYEVITDKLHFDILPLAASVIMITTVLFTRSVYLGLGILVWVIVFLIINFFFTKYKLKHDIARSKSETRSTGYLADTITNNTTIKFFASLLREMKGFKKTTKEVQRLRQFTWNLDSTFEAIQGFLMISLEIGILFLSLHLWQKNELTIGDFFLIQSYLMIIFHRVWDFGRVVRQIYERLADAEEMTEIINMPCEIQDAPNAKKLKAPNGEIKFNAVNFGYNQDESKMFKNFNLEIPAGQHIAIVGPSGGGKTTLVKLLVRFLNVKGGEILMDGQSISKVTQDSLRQHISFVPQDPILFHRTLLENIRYGNPNATEKEVIAASKKAHCHEFISKLPEKYGTYVGERGVKLSGGERQRVAIARAILENAPILILDEATSSLDSESELFIQDALKNVMKDKTTLIIAHRLSTIMKMDRIIVIQDGKITEDGSHQELLKVGDGTYQKLWEIQAGGFN